MNSLNPVFYAVYQLSEVGCRLRVIDMNAAFYNVTVNGRSKDAVTGIVFLLCCVCVHV